MLIFYSIITDKSFSVYLFSFIFVYSLFLHSTRLYIQILLLKLEFSEPLSWLQFSLQHFGLLGRKTSEKELSSSGHQPNGSLKMVSPPSSGTKQMLSLEQPSDSKVVMRLVYVIASNRNRIRK
jgi:hypothetical protein